ARRRWALGLMALSALSWWAWLAWWLLDASVPAASNWLVAGDVITLAAVVVLGDLRVGQWWGIVLAVAPHAIVSFWPIARSDPFGGAIWMVLAMASALGAAIISGLGALSRHPRWRRCA
ncbi:MAG: hypothetical protein ACRYF3_12560, partial [Janthinobacterium lividum]